MNRARIFLATSSEENLRRSFKWSYFSTKWLRWKKLLTREPFYTLLRRGEIWNWNLNGKKVFFILLPFSSSPRNLLSFFRYLPNLSVAERTCSNPKNWLLTFALCTANNFLRNYFCTENTFLTFLFHFENRFFKEGYMLNLINAESNI